METGDFALKGGLMPNAYRSSIYDLTGHPCQDDFRKFGELIGVLPKKIDAVIEMFTADNPAIEAMIEASFLDDRMKRMYIRSYRERYSRFIRSERV